MIESTEGLKNLDAILSMPGIGAVFIGNANDLRHSMGVPATSPEVEAARQTILAGCKRHNIACGITVASGADMVRRLGEGWKMIRATVEIIGDGTRYSGVGDVSLVPSTRFARSGQVCRCSCCAPGVLVASPRSPRWT